MVSFLTLQGATCTCFSSTGSSNSSLDTDPSVRFCRAGDALAQLHSDCLSKQHAVVVRWAGGASADAGRLLLVPLQALEGTQLMGVVCKQRHLRTLAMSAASP